MPRNTFNKMQTNRNSPNSTSSAMAFQPPEHDHARCVADALNTAAAICHHRGARLTNQRRAVLEIIWASHEPIGAYSIMERMGDGRRRAAPPTVYRALEFLTAHGLVHRIESLNAYVGCARPGEGDGEEHAGRFLLCVQCGSAAEIESDAIDSGIERAARDMNFAIHRATVEVRGICPNCREAGSSAKPV